jgi:hypothetical protein
MQGSRESSQKDKVINRFSFVFVVILSMGVFVFQLFSNADISQHSEPIVDVRQVEPVFEPVSFPDQINQPDGVPRVETHNIGLNGEPVTVGCMTCHTTLPPNFATDSGEELDEFHQNLNFIHGNLSCLSCHNSDNYDTLRLANSKTVEFPEVMQLCAQCHGTQYRDYQHGAHGGMNGYWSREMGPRYRNNCIDCHDPHAPAYTQMIPVPPANDRFLNQTSVVH